MVIFNSYVSLPEGISPRKMYKNQMEWSCWVIWKWSVKLWSAANAAKFKPVWIGVFREDKRRTELSTLRNSWVFHSHLVVLHVLNDHMYIHVLCVPVCTKYVCCSCSLSILLTIAFTYPSILKTIQSISVSSLSIPLYKFPHWTMTFAKAQRMLAKFCWDLKSQKEKAIGMGHPRARRV